MSELLVVVLLLSGGVLMLLAGVGIVRFPDLFTRMQATAKVATLGVALVLIAVAVHFRDLAVTVQAALVVAFFILTAPIAAHVIARAAYVIGLPPWLPTGIDELRGRYEPASRAPGPSGDAFK